MTNRSDCRLRGVALSSGRGPAVFVVANGSDDVLRRPKFILPHRLRLGCLWGLRQQSNGTHEQAFPQEGIRIMGDSGCLGAHSLNVWMTVGLTKRGKDNFH